MNDLVAHVNQKRHNPNSMTGLADSALEGVTVSFLAQVFRMDNAAVKRKLVNCPILESRKRGTTQVQHLYDLATAAGYLVEQKVDVGEIIRKLNKDDLPPSINATYWDAVRKRQIVEEHAGDLWRTAQVWEVLSGTFQTMKFSIQLWAETIERQTGLTEQQREILNGLADGLQQELYEALVKQAQGQRTGSHLDEITALVEQREQDAALDDEAASLI